MPIEAFSVISCATPPTENSHLANKKYVDEAVASASGGGGGGGASDRLTTNTQGVYAIGPPNIGMSTYLVPQTAIAAEYNANTTYQIGDICTYQGELWRRNFQSGKGVAPSSTGMLWQKVTVMSMLGSSGGGGSNKGTASVNSGNGTVDMTGNPEVIIDFYPMFLGTIGLILSNCNITGMLSVEVHLFYTSAGTRSSFKVQAGGDLVEVTWVRGGLSDLSTEGTHIVRLRKLANDTNITAEYVGKY